ncbi:radical SAM protein [Pseudomonas sp. KU26590]|uniref:B12-binding domain-containing radical SAM protein n=1 Tax=Pseudomonas sp. KU26590 TaxID=2991051 RepID=UPI00223DF284|nr:cobalamin-dependent protein [Pseudomonas sp. KU26590]UZJ57949.1 radical SAM protein [Pseudomonas sp. KU26590]
MLRVTLFSVPAPGQCIKGDDRFLGTVRTNMHKAPLTALVAGLRNTLSARNVVVDLHICDMQTQGATSYEDRCKVKYGELQLGDITLEKYRIGQPFEAVVSEITTSDVIGINSNFTHSRNIVADFIRFCAVQNPRAVIVLGGTDATVAPEFHIDCGAHVVVKGEGELCFADLLECIDKNWSFDNIPNIAFRAKDGTIQHTSKTFLSRSGAYDVNDMLPPDFELVDLESYSDTGEGKPPFGIQGPFISVETSRGCAQACSFCATPSTKGRFRFMQLEKIRQHFEYFKSKGIRTLLLQEDNLLSRIHRHSSGHSAFDDGRDELFDMFNLARDMGFCWEFTNGIELGQFEHEGVVDHELIRVMFDSTVVNGDLIGCYRATLPLENLTDESSKLFRKLKPLGVIKNVLESIVNTGVHSLSFNVIIGRPEDDEHNLCLTYLRSEEIRSVCKAFNSKVQIYFNVYILSLLPGTVDFKRHHDRLAYDLNVDPEVITFYLGSLNTDYYSPLEITQARGAMAKMLNNDALIDDYDEVHYISSDRFERLFASADSQQLRTDFISIKNIHPGS